MSLEQRIKSLVAVRNILHSFLTKENQNTPTYSEFESALRKAENKNPWFTKKNILYALKYWDETLSYENLSGWLARYRLKDTPKTVGLVLAGNIPMVGFHDCLCVLLVGYKARIKLSSKDAILIPFFLNLWKEFCEELDFEFVEKLEKINGVITTGSNNTAKYFEYYFKEIPHIIRKNRSSLAILTGNETEEELNALSKDIFTYFGLGCRNVTQILIPENYSLDNLFQSFFPYKEVINHNKYANNYDYNKAIYLMNNDQFWDNNFIILKESGALYSPIGVLYFKTYTDYEAIERFIAHNMGNIQCLVTNGNFENLFSVPLGESQNPKINEYADGVNTLDFLLSI